MRSIKKYSGVLLTVLLCILLSVMMAMTASAALVVGPAPGDDTIIDTEDTLSKEGTETPDIPLTSEEEEEDPATSTEETESDAESDTESAESEEGDTSTEPEGGGEEETSSEEYTEGDESYYEEEDGPTYYPGNGENITGVIGNGEEGWGTNYSEGTVVSQTGSTAKKNIADYHSKMLSLIWIPIVLIALSAGTLVAVNVYFSKKKGKKAKKSR